MTTREKIWLCGVGVVVSVVAAVASGHRPVQVVVAASVGAVVSVAVVLVSDASFDYANDQQGMASRVGTGVRVLGVVVWGFLTTGAVLSAQEGDWSILPIPATLLAIYIALCVRSMRGRPR